MSAMSASATELRAIPEKRKQKTLDTNIRYVVQAVRQKARNGETVFVYNVKVDTDPPSYAPSDEDILNSLKNAFVGCKVWKNSERPVGEKHIALEYHIDWTS